MKKALFFFLLLSLNRLSAQDYLLPLQSDSTHNKYWDSASGTLQSESYSRQFYDTDDLLLSELFTNIYGTDTSYYQYNYTYDPQKRLQNYISYQSNTSPNGQWQNWLREDYDYDATDRLTHYTGQFGNQTGWDNYYQETFWFDDALHTDSSIFQLYNFGIQEWVNNSKSDLGFNADNNTIYNHHFDWDSDLSIWNPKIFNDYTYYPDGKLKTNTDVYHFDAATYDFRADSNIYRADGRLDTVYSHHISYPSGDRNDYFTANTYNANGDLINATTFIMTQAGAYPSNRTLYSPPDGVYSSSPGSQLAQNYDLPTQIWKPQWMRTLSFMPLTNNRVLEIQESRQVNANGELAMQELDYTWYHLGTVSTSTPEMPSADCTFANPYTPGSPVICNADDISTPLQLRLTNLIGQPVAQARVMPGEAWTPPAGLGAGMYVLQVWQNGRRLGLRKMILH